MSRLKPPGIDATSDVPKYRQLKAILTQMARALPADALIPSEYQLAEQFGVHRLTARQAITELVKENILYRQHGRGTFVAPSPVKPTPTSSRVIATFFRELRDRREDDNYFLEIAKGLEEEIAENGFVLTHCRLAREQPGRNRLTQTVQTLLQLDLAGLVFDERVPDEVLEALAPFQRPVVMVNRPCRVPGVPAVYPDTQAFAQKILHYLLDLGHRRLLVLYELADPNQLALAEQIKRSYAEAGLDSRSLRLEPAHETGKDGKPYRLAAATGILQHQPTAIVAGLDWIALNVYAQALEMGLVIAKDISVMSVGDLELASRLTPALTTLRIPTREIGRAAARLILDGGQEDIRIAPELVARASCTNV